MNTEQALQKTDLLLEGSTYRSDVLSLINELDCHKLITSRACDQLVDILYMDSRNVRPVLRSIRSQLLMSKQLKL